MIYAAVNLAERDCGKLFQLLDMVIKVYLCVFLCVLFGKAQSVGMIALTRCGLIQAVTDLIFFILSPVGLRVCTNKEIRSSRFVLRGGDGVGYVVP